MLSRGMIRCSNTTSRQSRERVDDESWMTHSQCRYGSILYCDVSKLEGSGSARAQHTKHVHRTLATLAPAGCRRAGDVKAHIGSLHRCTCAGLLYVGSRFGCSCKASQLWSARLSSLPAVLVMAASSMHKCCSLALLLVLSFVSSACGQASGNTTASLKVGDYSAGQLTNGTALPLYTLLWRAVGSSFSGNNLALNQTFSENANTAFLQAPHTMAYTVVNLRNAVAANTTRRLNGVTGAASELSAQQP